LDVRYFGDVFGKSVEEWMASDVIGGGGQTLSHFWGAQPLEERK
jgi:hypothetical protein